MTYHFLLNKETIILYLTVVRQNVHTLYLSVEKYLTLKFYVTEKYFLSKKVRLCKAYLFVLLF